MKMSMKLTTVLAAVVALPIFTFIGPAPGELLTMSNATRGGRLYDKWWREMGVDPPEGDHPLYPEIGEKSGSATFRCKECHGWDYKGRDGAYGSGSHYTGIIGVLGSSLTPQEMFDLIKRDDINNGHGFGNYGMADQDINDVVEFLQSLLFEMDPYIDVNKDFLGNEIRGEMLFTTAGSPRCVDCHGEDGTHINFGDPDDPEWLGTIAVHNPWEWMHKVRVGQPGTSMPSWVDQGFDTQGIADMGKHGQMHFPVGPLQIVYPEDINIMKGMHFGGDIADLAGADDVWYHTKSGWGNNFVEAHIFDAVIGTTTTEGQAAREVIVTVESHVNQPAGIARLYLHNWTNDQFEEIFNYSIGETDERLSITGLSPTAFIRAGDGRIEVEIKNVVFAPFFSFRFDSFFDEVKVNIH